MNGSTQTDFITSGVTRHTAHSLFGSGIGAPRRHAASECIPVKSAIPRRTSRVPRRCWFGCRQGTSDIGWWLGVAGRMSPGSVVGDAVEDPVGDCRIADDRVPVIDRRQANDDVGAALVALLDDRRASRTPYRPLLVPEQL